MTDPTLSNKYWEWKAEQPTCIGFMRGCDGYLVGQEHDEQCPCYGKSPITEEDVFKAAYTLGLSQGQARINEIWGLCEAGAGENATIDESEALMKIWKIVYQANEPPKAVKNGD